jgi:hypothetical protein
MTPWIAEANNFGITVARKTADATVPKAVKSGEPLTEKTETVFYQVTVANTAFKPSAALKAKYIVFVERQEIGEKAGSEQIEKIKGSADVKELKPREKETFSTSEIKLKEKGVTGNYIYTSGGRIRAKDSLAGVWVKLYEGETEVAEYVNPTTLSNKHKWNVD